MDVHRESSVDRKGSSSLSNLPITSTNTDTSLQRLDHYIEWIERGKVGSIYKNDQFINYIKSAVWCQSSSQSWSYKSSDLDYTGTLFAAMLFDIDTIEKEDILTKYQYTSKIDYANLLQNLDKIYSKFQYSSTHIACRALTVFVNTCR